MRTHLSVLYVQGLSPSPCATFHMTRDMWEWADLQGMIHMATSVAPQHVTLTDGTEDTRYTVRCELTGHECRWYVARFEGHWVGESTTEERAWDLARQHAKGRG